MSSEQKQELVEQTIDQILYIFDQNEFMLFEALGILDIAKDELINGTKAQYYIDMYGDDGEPTKEKP